MTKIELEQFSGKVLVLNTFVLITLTEYHTVNSNAV